MQKGVVSTSGSNVLVQWDQAMNNKTWRYRILPGSMVEDGSLTSEMGSHPENELVAAMQWVITNYPAKRYALILWNHGSGIEDLRALTANIPMARQLLNSWLEIPGAPTIQQFFEGRGILYDDSQNTVLNNQGLTSALARIKAIIGKNIDIIGMDACLMGMLEVAYQIKDFADYFVASQQTVPGEGWAYSTFLKPLTANPGGTSPLQLAQNIVSAYKQFYTGKKDAADFTLSAIDLAGVQTIKQSIDQVLGSIASCFSLDAVTTRTMVIAARNLSTELYMPEYIDLYSFYSGLLNQIQRIVRTTPKSNKVLAQICNNQPRAQISPAYANALHALANSLFYGMQKIQNAVVKNAAGPQLASVQGLSIYYPRSGTIHASYLPTMFAQESSWISFIQAFR
jgi:hypothetical protein